jgi:hypothetical protein
LTPCCSGITDDEHAAVAKALRKLIDEDRFPLSPRLARATDDTAFRLLLPRRQSAGRRWLLAWLRPVYRRRGCPADGL